MCVWLMQPILKNLDHVSSVHDFNTKNRSITLQLKEENRRTPKSIYQARNNTVWSRLEPNPRGFFTSFP